MESRTISAKQDLAWSFALAGSFLLLYLRTLCPTVYLGDSGELCTAIGTGGVPHPPGYPLFSLLGRAALALVPVGEPAFRIGCLVVLAAAGAVAALYFLAREIGCSPWAAVTGAAVFGTSYTFWNQSTRVEVYSLHVLLVALVLLFALRYRRAGAHRDLAVGLLALSLGLAHHLTVVLLGPALLLLCGRRLWLDPNGRKRLGLMAMLLPVGPVCYLLLLLWARTEPLHAWGNTIDLPRLLNHASARIFRIFMEAPDSSDLPRVFGQAGALFLDNFPFLISLLPLAGAVALWRRDRVVAAAMALVLLAVSGYNLCYQIDDIAAYYVTVWMLAAALLAIALEFCWGFLGRLNGSRAAAGLASLLLVGAPIARNWRTSDLSQATWVRDFARQKLEAAQPGSVLITHGDDDINPIWYVHHLLGVRRDVTPIDRAWAGGRTWGLYDWDPSLWYLYRLRRQGVRAPLQVPADPAARDALAQDGYLVGLLDHELRGRPLSITSIAAGSRLADWIYARYLPLPVGLVMRLHPKEAPVDLPGLLRESEAHWARMTLPDLGKVRTDQEIAPRYVTSHYACMLVNLGGLYERAGQYERAAGIYERAARWAPGYGGAVQALAALRQRGETSSLVSPAGGMPGRS